MRKKDKLTTEQKEIVSEFLIQIYFQKKFVKRLGYLRIQLETFLKKFLE
ncbi:MAG: hypothetical protein WC516_08300 [Patescibacteria group bacterium]